jgi:hypothetical protein
LAKIKHDYQIGFLDPNHGASIREDRHRRRPMGSGIAHVCSWPASVVINIAAPPEGGAGRSTAICPVEQPPAHYQEQKQAGLKLISTVETTTVCPTAIW